MNSETCRPVNAWRAIALARVHTCQYLFRRAIVARAKLSMTSYDKFRFNFDIDLPLNKTIEFRSLVINVTCIIEKDNEYYPEIYLDECLYVKDNTWYAKYLFSERIKFPTERIVFSNIK